MVYEPSRDGTTGRTLVEGTPLEGGAPFGIIISWDADLGGCPPGIRRMIESAIANQFENRTSICDRMQGLLAGEGFGATALPEPSEEVARDYVAAFCGPDDLVPPELTRMTPAQVQREFEPIVWRVLTAVLEEDVEALLAEVRLRTEACAGPRLGAGGPPLCDQGDAAGTEYEVFPFTHCEGGWARDPEAFLESAVRQAGAPYAIAVAAEDYLGGELVPVFAADEGLSPLQAQTFVIGDGALLRVDGGCQPAGLVVEPFDLTERFSEDFAAEYAAWCADVDALPPPLGAIVAAVLGGDAEALMAMTAMQDVACVPPPPRDPAGSRYAVLPVADCEGHWARDLLALFRGVLDAAGDLFAVAALDPAEGRGEYAVIFDRADGYPVLAAQVFFVSDGRIVRQAGGCIPARVLVDLARGFALPITDFLIPPPAAEGQASS